MTRNPIVTVGARDLPDFIGRSEIESSFCLTLQYRRTVEKVTQKLYWYWEFRRPLLGFSASLNHFHNRVLSSECCRQVAKHLGCNTVVDLHSLKLHN
jgi:hypothetical protein